MVKTFFAIMPLVVNTGKKKSSNLTDDLMVARMALPLFHGNVQLTRANTFSGYRMVNVQSGARHQMVKAKSFDAKCIGFHRPFYVEIGKSPNKCMLGSFSTNIEAAVCVANYLKAKVNIKKNIKVRTAKRKSQRPRTVVNYAEQEVQGAQDSKTEHWVQCDICDKWRKTPHRMFIKGEWTCSMNPDRRANDCTMPEESYVCLEASSQPTEPTFLEKLELLKTEFEYHEKNMTATEIVDEISLQTGILMPTQGNLRNKVETLYDELR